MIFTKEHIEKIRAGQKTETRRIWKKPHVKVGNVYGCRTDRFKPTPEDATKIKVLDIHKELLREMGNLAAKREGCASKQEFIRIWEKLHGSWNPEQEVYVIRFEVKE